MANPSFSFFSSNIDLVKKIIDFFVMEIVNPEKFKEAQKICIKNTENKGRWGSEELIKSGYLSIYDYTFYMRTINQIPKGGLSLEPVERLIPKLVEHHILCPMNEIFQDINGDRRWKHNGDYTKFMYENDLILNAILGWPYVINKYSNSVFLIENISKKNEHDSAFGTGFHIKDENRAASYIFTNKHVIDNSSSIKIITREEDVLSYSNIYIDCNTDLAFIEMPKVLESAPFLLTATTEILTEIVTIGYPSIPTTKQNYQTSHLGEINSFVEDFWGNKYFLYSAKTSSGNSGSPIIDPYGMVTGIATQELFEKESFHEKGKPAYYAGIPSYIVSEAFYRSVPE